MIAHKAINSPPRSPIKPNFFALGASFLADDACVTFVDLAASCSSAVLAVLFAVAFTALMHVCALEPLAVMVTEALPLLEVALTVMLLVVFS